LGETHAPLGAAESVTGSRAEVVEDVLTLTQLHNGLVGDLTNRLEVGIQLEDASLYAADARAEPEGVPATRRQRVGLSFERRGVPPQPLGQPHLHFGDRGDALTEPPDERHVSAQLSGNGSLRDAAVGRHPLDAELSRHMEGVQVVSCIRNKGY